MISKIYTNTILMLLSTFYCHAALFDKLDKVLITAQSFISTNAAEYPIVIAANYIKIKMGS